MLRISIVAGVGGGFGVGLGLGLGFRLFSGGANNLFIDGGYSIINLFVPLSLYISNAPTSLAPSLAALIDFKSFISLVLEGGVAATF